LHTDQIDPRNVAQTPYRPSPGVKVGYSRVCLRPVLPSGVRELWWKSTVGGPRFATSEFAKPGIARRPCGAPRGVPVLAKLDDDFERGDQERVWTILGRGDLRHEQRGHVERWSGSSSIRASPLSSTPLARRPPSSMSPRRSRFSPKSQRYSSSASTSSLIRVGEDNGTPVWRTPLS
jgi:hypothetical protein